MVIYLNFPVDSTDAIASKNAVQVMCLLFDKKIIYKTTHIDLSYSEYFILRFLNSDNHDLKINNFLQYSFSSLTC